MMLIKKIAGTLLLALFMCGCSQKTVQAQTAAKDPEQEKIELVLSKMSPRAQKELKIADRSEFLKDLKSLLQEEESFSKDDISLFYLIDKTHKVSSAYEPKNLKHLVNNDAYKVNKNNLSLRPEAYEALYEMAKAAKNDKVNLTISSTYRSYEYQKNLFDYWVRVDGLEEAERESARPGTSQHQLGCAIDFAPVDDAFDQTPAGKWVYENAEKFGWSLSFPKNYEDITGYRWESWHFRYLGKNACRFQKKYFLNVQQYMLEFIELWKKN